MSSVMAVIQAGGLGTRMWELTQDRIPKPMIPLNGKPLIERQIESLIDNGINNFVFIVGHLGEQIRDYFGDGRKWGVNISYIEEYKPLGSAGALYYLKKYSFDDFLLIFGDVMFDMDISCLLDFHRNNNAKITLVMHPNTHPFDSDLLIVNDKNQVTGVLGKSEKRGECYQNLVNSGISVFSNRIIEDFEKICRVDWERDVVNRFISECSVYGYRTSEYIKDVGIPERFRKAEIEQSSGIWEMKNLSNRQKCVFLDRDGTINKLVGLVDRPEQISLYEGVSEAICLLNGSGFLVIVVTNQPVVARGLCSEDEVRIINSRMEVLLGQEGAYVDDIIFCPHHPDKGYPEENPAYKIKCTCRKPEIGMIKQMQKKYNIDLSSSYMIGDTTTDMQTGVNASMHTILLKTGEGGKDGKYDVKPEHVADNLLAAVKIILN